MSRSARFWWRVIAAGAAAPAVARSSEDVPLRVRLAALSPHELTVLGVQQGELILRPVGSAEGEVAVPIAEVRDLHVVLPPSYRQAQQLLFQNQLDQALDLLDAWAPGLMPLVSCGGDSVIPMVNRYLELLLRADRWEDAHQLIHRLPEDAALEPFVPSMVQLAGRWLEQGNVDRTQQIAARIAGHSETATARAAVRRLADELRRRGHWAAAGALYLRLSASAEAEPDIPLLLAYVALRQDESGAAREHYNRVVLPDGSAGTAAALAALVAGELALLEADAPRALDLLSRAVVYAPPGDEWTRELVRTLARAYRAAGQEAVAASIEDDLQRFFAGAPERPSPPDGSTGDT